MLHMIYDYTKNWTSDDLERIYDKADNMGRISSSRDEIIIKTLGVGKYLMKKIFGIDLDISELPSLIKNTKMIGLNELESIVRYVIKHGQYREVQFGDTKYLKFNPKSWIRHPIHKVQTKILEGKEQLTLPLAEDDKREVWLWSDLRRQAVFWRL